MKCPACDGILTSVTVGSNTVDVCNERCGGIWFDAGEFEHFDEPAELAPNNVIHAVPNQTVVVDRNRARHCPHCTDAKILTKRFFDAAHELQIDQCDVCHGVWADLGELATIRRDNENAQKRKAVIDDFYARAEHPTGTEKSKNTVRGVLELLFR